MSAKAALPLLLVLSPSEATASWTGLPGLLPNALAKSAATKVNRMTCAVNASGFLFLMLIRFLCQLTLQEHE